jgi:Mg-chelatase subunit ChlD
MTQPAHQQPGHPHVKPIDLDWAEWNKAWTKHARRHADRADLIVVVAPGAGGGAPACFYPDLQRIEVDARYLGGKPDVADPRRAVHKQSVPTGYGLLVHEAAHAAHSRWTIPPGTPPVVAEVADLLEESRAEGRQRHRRRGDRRWLRHTVTTLLVPAKVDVDDAWHAGKLAGLLLARVDARIITAKETRAVRVAVTSILGKRRVQRLKEIWKDAHACEDTDADTMIDLAWRWCQTIGIDPYRQPNAPTPDAGQFAGRLAAALTDYLAAAIGTTPGALTDLRLTHRHAAPAAWTRRDPTTDEIAAARRLGRRLQHARTQHREQATAPSLVPPGRLRARQAITADAQTAAGLIPTAQQWQRRSTQPPMKPTLLLAVLVDISGSMGAYARQLSSAGWILANGARRSDAITTTIAFDDTATLLIAPRTRPTQVLQMRARGGTSGFCDAVKLADQLLDLRRRNTLRMVAVVSDGDLPDPAAAQRLITALHRAGCAVLWLRPKDMAGDTYTDTTTIEVADPVHAVGEVCAAAISALAKA